MERRRESLGEEDRVQWTNNCRFVHSRDTAEAEAMISAGIRLPTPVLGGSPRRVMAYFEEDENRIQSLL